MIAQRICAVTAIKFITTGTASDSVITVTAENCVCTSIAQQHVIARPTIDCVITFTANNSVIACFCIDHITTAGTSQHISVFCAIKRPDACKIGVGQAVRVDTFECDYGITDNDCCVTRVVLTNEINNIREELKTFNTLNVDDVIGRIEIGDEVITAVRRDNEGIGT